jgi:RecB family endonuclease NucS
MPDDLPLDQVQEVLLDAIGRGKTVFLVCTCEIDYVGRAKSTLGLGERMVMIKADGTIIIHQKSGRNPVNWMPPRTRTELAVEDGVLTLVSTKRREGERMVVRVASAKRLETFHLEDYERLDIYGTEKDFVKELIENPSLIEKGFRLSKNERITIAGNIDISGVDAQGRPVVVEVKRGRATPQDVIQLKRYVENVEKKTDERVRGILVAPSSSSRARRLLVEYDLELRRVHPLRLKRKRAQSNLSKFIAE